jgi:signal transduction histidine kinase
VPIEGSVGGEVVRTMRPQRLGDVRSRLRFGLAGRVDAEVGLLVPLVFRGRALGVLEAFDREDGEDFSPDDERLLTSFAASAATAVATAQTAASESLSRSIRASERERTRWARELHDETLQQLAGLKVLLSGARRRGQPERLDAAIGQAIEQITDSIAELRRLIADLRPATLDDLGLAAAVESLVERVQHSSGLKATVRVDLGAERLPATLEDTAYRLVQEALTNVVKHAGATEVAVTLVHEDHALLVTVADNGVGLDPGIESEGFGLIGMRERVALAGGTLAITEVPDGGRGTLIAVRLPVSDAAAPQVA